MATWLLRSILWQLLVFALVFPAAHLVFKWIRTVTPRIGPSETLFPRKLIWDEKASNENRVKIAEKIVENANFSKNHIFADDVEIRVVASNRGNSYLFQTIAFLLEQQPVGKYNLTICNVESEKFADLRKFENLVPIETVGGRKRAAASSHEKSLNNSINKENDDYWRCLEFQTNHRKLIWDEKASNENRVKIAEKIVETANFSKNRIFADDLEIRVVASNRGNSYLFQTIAFLLEQQPVAKYNLTICNVESEKFADLGKFENLVPIETVGGRKRAASSHEKSLNNSINKENDDYWRCLEFQTNHRYTLLIEDDSLIISQFSVLLKSLIRHLDENRYVDYVKLYHPNYLRKLPSYVLIIAFSIMISYTICAIFKTYPFLTFFLLSGAISRDLIGYGCQFPADLRFALTGSAYISYPESCCTPAVIFRTSSVPRMVDYFKKTSAFSGHAKDHILDESPFVGRQSDVNYVTHIGSFSSVRQRVVQLADLRDAR